MPVMTAAASLQYTLDSAVVVDHQTCNQVAVRSALPTPAPRGMGAQGRAATQAPSSPANLCSHRSDPEPARAADVGTYLALCYLSYACGPSQTERYGQPLHRLNLAGVAA